MKKIELSQASKPLAEYAAELGDDMVVVTVDERPIAAVISLKNVENADEESLALSASREFLDIIERSRAELAAGKSLSLAEMKPGRTGSRRRRTSAVDRTPALSRLTGTSAGSWPSASTFRR